MTAHKIVKKQQKSHKNAKPYLTVIAIIEAKKGYEARVRKALQGLIEPTLQEKGCIDYELHVRKDNKAVFLFYENWLSKSSLDKHLATPHLNQFARTCKGWLARPVSITLWRRIG